PLPIAPSLHAGELGLALLFGLLTAVAFAVWPLGRTHDVSVTALFRDEIAPQRRSPRSSYVAAAVVLGCVLATLTIVLAYDRRIAAIFIAVAATVLLLLRGIASMLMAVASRIPRPGSA